MAVRRYRFVQVDVFTRRPFGGNQLAVFVDAQGLSAAEMQMIAVEMNYSESTFVLPAAGPKADARVRIFTPARELPFAGHPVVGTGFVLGCERGKRALRFELGVGPLDVRADPGDGRTGGAEMEQPLPTFLPSFADAPTIAQVLGLDAADVDPSLPCEVGSAGVPFLYLPLRSLDAVRRARVDGAALAHLFEGRDHPAVYMFSRETVSPEATAHARMFFQRFATDFGEDPATGGASGPMGAYLVRHKAAKPGRLLLEQGYEMGRPSEVEVVVNTQYDAVSRVAVGGGVVKIAEGELLV